MFKHVSAKNQDVRAYFKVTQSDFRITKTAWKSESNYSVLFPFLAFMLFVCPPFDESPFCGSFAKLNSYLGGMNEEPSPSLVGRWVGKEKGGLRFLSLYCLAHDQGTQPFPWCLCLFNSRFFPSVAEEGREEEENFVSWKEPDKFLNFCSRRKKLRKVSK